MRTSTSESMAFAIEGHLLRSKAAMLVGGMLRKVGVKVGLGRVVERLR